MTTSKPNPNALAGPLRIWANATRHEVTSRPEELPSGSMPDGLEHLATIIVCDLRAFVARATDGSIIYCFDVNNAHEIPGPWVPETTFRDQTSYWKAAGALDSLRARTYRWFGWNRLTRQTG